MDLSDHDKRTDQMLWQMMEECKSIPTFFDAVFGFLRRHTDYYYVCKTPNEKMGFPAGMKEKMLMCSMERFEDKSSREKALEKKLKPALQSNKVTNVKSDKEHVTTIDKKYIDKSVKEKKQMTSKEDRKFSRKHNFEAHEYKNGAAFENYSWSQSLREVELYVKVPEIPITQKDIKVVLKPRSIVVECLLYDRIILSGEVNHKFKCNEVIWTLMDGKIQIAIDKCKAEWWDKLFIHEQVIDTCKIDTTECADEIPAETQAALTKFHAEQIALERKME